MTFSLAEPEPVAGGEEDQIPDMEEFEAEDNLEDEDPVSVARTYHAMLGLR